MVDADEISLKEYLEDDDYNDEKVDLYIRIWNQVRRCGYKSELRVRTQFRKNLIELELNLS